jgi:hypothetical protein
MLLIVRPEPFHSDLPTVISLYRKLLEKLSTALVLCRRGSPAFPTGFVGFTKGLATSSVPGKTGCRQVSSNKINELNGSGAFVLRRRQPLWLPLTPSKASTQPCLTSGGALPSGKLGAVSRQSGFGVEDQSPAVERWVISATAPDLNRVIPELLPVGQ